MSENYEALKVKLSNIIASVKKADSAAMDAARARQAQLAKPPGSLGVLEELSIQLAGITGKVNNRFEKKHLLVFAADNGVVCEGISSAPQSVTLSQTVNLTRGKTGAAVLAKHFGCSLTVCDVGVNANIAEPAVLNRKIAYGTNNIAKGAAMTKEQALTAILTGAELVQNTDADIFGIGEMGIGNTTTASAVLSVLLGLDAEEVTGRGGGLTDESFKRKKEVIRQAININNPDKDDITDVLSKVGGFDIAAMCGAFLGAAATRKPVVIDGFISAVAALCAVRLCPVVRDCLICSHASYELGYNAAVNALGLKPMLSLGMRLGEGSGCPLAFQVIEAACAVINNMATFPEANINDGYLEEIRKGDKFTPKGDSMGKLILISGGNGSGKSLFAEKLIGKMVGERYYIATMIPSTADNYARIEKHRKQRQELGFTTFELPYDIKNAPVHGGVVLLEDVSNLLANNIFEKGNDAEAVLCDICALKEKCSVLVAVTISNLTPDGYEGETASYINGLNFINDKLSHIAETVITMQDEKPVYLKGDTDDIF